MDNLLINGTRYVSNIDCKELILNQIDHLLLIHKVMLLIIIFLTIIISILMLKYYQKVKND